MKLLSFLTLGLALNLAALATAQSVVGLQPTEVAEALEVQPALDATAPIELIEAEALGCLTKGARESVYFDRLDKKVYFAFTMKNADTKRGLLGGMVVRSIYTRPAMQNGPEVDSAAFRVRIAPGGMKTLSGVLNWDAPEGSVPRLVLPDPVLRPETILRAQFEAVPTASDAAALPDKADPALIDAEACAQLTLGREAVTWNRRDRTVSFTFVLRNRDAKRALVVGGQVKTMSTRPKALTGPETDNLGFRVRIPAGETRVIAGTLSWDDLGGLAVPRIALPDAELHPEQILRVQFEGLEPAP